ncbi:methyltransferase [Nonomuraea thailandensis]
MGHLVGRAAATRSAPLRVVELGAGAGGSTAAALDGLGDAQADYLFTDVSRFFTMAAEDRFGDRLRYALLDINADLVAQGAVRGGADVVIAANVLHCARHAGRSLRWIRSCWPPAGWSWSPRRSASTTWCSPPCSSCCPPGRGGRSSAPVTVVAARAGCS